MEQAILLSKEYNSEALARKIEKIPSIWCRLEDDNNFNWYLISKSNKKSVLKYYGYLSTKFPVALLMKNCPSSIYKLLQKNKIFIEQYCKRYSCKESILKQYVTGKIFIGDSFLYDENLVFNEELFLKIDEGIIYLNPHNFSFDDIT